MISVIVPVYNAAAYLPDLFASLLAQTHAPKEVIFVNDGSTDNSSELIHSFKENVSFPVKLIEKENSGSAATRNRGLAETSGDYLIFLDSDDLLERRRIETDLDEIAKTKAHFVFGPVEIFEELSTAKFANSKHQKNLHAVASGDILQSILSRDLFLVPCMATVSRQLAQTIGGFDETLRYGEDFDFWIRIFSQRPIFYYSQICKAKYRFGHGSKSSHIEKKHTFRMKIYDKFYRTEISNEYAAIKNYTYASVTMSTAADFYRYKKFGEFRRYAREAMKLSLRLLNFKIAKRYMLSFLKASK